MSTGTYTQFERSSTASDNTNGNGVDGARDLGQIVRQIYAEDDTPEGRRRRLMRSLLNQPDVVAATSFEQANSRQWQLITPLMCLPELSATAEDWAAPLCDGARAAASSSAAKIIPLWSNSQELVGVFAPVPFGGTVKSIVCLVGTPGRATRARLSLMAQLVAAETAMARLREDAAGPQVDGRLTDNLLGAILSVTSDGDIDRGYAEVGNQLRAEMNCDSVLLGVRCGVRGRCILRAMSGVSGFRRHSPLATCAEEVLNEAVLRDAVDYYDAATPSPTATDSHKKLAQLRQLRGIASGPIRDRSHKVVGAWAILPNEMRGDSRETALRPPNDWMASVRNTADGLSSRLWPCLELLELLRPRLLHRITRNVFGSNFRSRRGLLLGALVGLVCLMVLPLPYRVKCDCEVQPVTRRFVPVPYDGVLEEVVVEPGDVVKAGQTLARMDGREVEWELAAQQAEYNRSQKQYDVQLAARDTSAAQVVRLEMERLSLQIKLLRNRAENLEIRSPIDGVVIGGDPKKIESARLTKGESLFEIGPLERMVVDVLVPDEDVSYVKEGQKVQIRLDALSGSTRNGTIRRISPQAEPRENANVFVAEVELDNHERLLRPGMMGRGKVRTVVRPLVWNLFHRPWDQLVYHVAW